MHNTKEFEEICSISQMADRLKLSRPRFYQLRESGIFPPPVYCPRTRHPFYPLEIQKKCLRIRETGIGMDGKPVVLYKPRKSKTKRNSKPINDKDLQCYQEWVSVLKDWDIKVSVNQIREAVNSLFPKGLPKDRNDNSIITTLFEYFNSGHKNDV
ncbi:MAG: hypothetical protein JXB29_07695 [Sedimentisphaerales bacterium]|nr:hypothetical protein [Sedimentisphaerales bacterium]